MEPRDIVLITLAALGGKVAGKTKLQKLVYFVGLLAGRERELGYDAHYYGPYSATVEEAVYELTSLGLVDAHVQRTGEMGEGGFEKTFYQYQLAEGGAAVACRKAEELGPDAAGISAAADRMRDYLDRHYMRLAAAAKIQYLIRQTDGSLTAGRVKELAAGLGWPLTDEAVEDAVNTLVELGLAKRSQMTPQPV